MRHTLDVMHIERNVMDNILRTVLGDKDTPAVREDMRELSIRPGLWLQERDDIPAGTKLKPHAPYVLDRVSRTKFLVGIGKLKVPSGYSGSLRKHVVKGKIQNLKSHDMHILSQQILPVAVRHVLHPGARAGIIRLSVLFQKICAKVVVPGEIPWLKEYAAETLCILEAWFPPSFWDIMSHLVIHLVDELAICGPVACRWMYPMERYMGVLKKYVRNRSLPEGSMAEGYIVEEALGLCTEFLQGFQHTRTRVWDAEEEPGISGVELEGHGSARRLADVELNAAHLHVVTNSPATESYYRLFNFHRTWSCMCVSCGCCHWYVGILGIADFIERVQWHRMCHVGLSWTLRLRISGWGIIHEGCACQGVVAHTGGNGGR